MRYRIREKLPASNFEDNFVLFDYRDGTYKDAIGVSRSYFIDVMTCDKSVEVGLFHVHSEAEEAIGSIKNFRENFYIERRTNDRWVTFNFLVDIQDMLEIR